MWTDLDARSRRITIEESAFTAEITVIRPQGWGGSAAPSAKDAETAETAAEPGAEYGVDIAATDSRHAAAMNMAYFNAKEDAARRLRERGDFPALEEHIARLQEAGADEDINHTVEVVCGRPIRVWIASLRVL